MKGKNIHAMFASLLIVASLLFVVWVSQMAKAEPEGASLQNLSTTTKSASYPDNRTDPKGTITTLLLTTVQQNIRWKAYVGNVTGTLVLRDAETYSIYEWPSGGSPDGKVFIARNSSIDWSTIQCANETQILAEQALLGHSASALDNINNTFSYRIHENFDVGVIPIAQSSCKSTFTWVNNTAQAPSVDALFQEVLLMDASSKIVYTALLDPDTRGYKDDDETIYDFQAIVPDFSTAAIATYYFYVEIQG